MCLPAGSAGIVKAEVNKAFLTIGDPVTYTVTVEHSPDIRILSSIPAPSSDFLEIKKVEDIVNEKIKENLKVYKKSMPKEAAQGIGAIGLFDQKYGDLVSVYYISSGDDIDSAYSKEFCGGPHCVSTGQLKSFKIIKEESAGANIRRVYATIDW